MLVTDDKHLLIVSSKWRSKWLIACCTCGKRGRRKDGSCKHIRSLLTDPRIRPEVKPRLRYVPLPMGVANELDPEEKITVALKAAGTVDRRSRKQDPGLRTGLGDGE